MLTVYEKEACQGCRATKKYLNKYEIPFEIRHVSELTPEQIGAHQQAPVVIRADGQSWSGFRPDLIKALIA